jgi:transcription elongation factor Elf1
MHTGDMTCPACGEDATDSPELDCGVGITVIECAECGESIAVRGTLRFDIVPMPEDR